jgi:hypothetical protein
MSFVRGLLFDNLGVKLIALVMALLVYLNAYTDRPAMMVFSFPIQVDGIPDSLSLSGPLPAVVQAELRGTGKQLIRLRLTEPRLRVSVAGVSTGRFERAIAETDLPISPTSGLSVERLIGPRMLQLTIDRRSEKLVPLAARVSGTPGAGAEWNGKVITQPSTVRVNGPARVLADLDSLVLPAIRIDGRRDTVRAQVAPEALPDWCTAEPALVRVLVPLRRRDSR